MNLEDQISEIMDFNIIPDSVDTKIFSDGNGDHTVFMIFNDESGNKFKIILTVNQIHVLKKLLTQIEHNTTNYDYIIND